MAGRKSVTNSTADGMRDLFSTSFKDSHPTGKWMDILSLLSPTLGWFCLNLSIRSSCGTMWFFHCYPGKTSNKTEDIRPSASQCHLNLICPKTQIGQTAAAALLSVWIDNTCPRCGVGWCFLGQFWSLIQKKAAIQRSIWEEKSCPSALLSDFSNGTTMQSPKAIIYIVVAFVQDMDSRIRIHPHHPTMLNLAEEIFWGKGERIHMYAP